MKSTANMNVNIFPKLKKVFGLLNMCGMSSNNIKWLPKSSEKNIWKILMRGVFPNERRFLKFGDFFRDGLF